MQFITVNGNTVLSRACRIRATPAGSLLPDIAPITGRPAPPFPGRFAGKCVAITSLSPNPARQERQERCMESWRDIGLPIIAVQTADEIRRLSPASEHLTYQVSEHLTTDYDRPTQRISTLVDVGRQTKLPFLLINSDIELSRHPQPIWDALAAPEKLSIGVRYNHAARQLQADATREPWGLDCFLMTPAMAATVPALPFGIGKPGWDYWLPHHFRNRGCAFHWLAEPLLFHERHPLGWSNADWLLGADWLESHYGIRLTLGSAAYRQSLHEPMDPINEFISSEMNFKSQISNLKS